MRRLKCVVAYDGTDFEGYQVQPGKRTVQGEIERVLMRMHKGQKIKVYASGRTDARVHAKGQVIHFDTFLNIPEDRWPVALNAMLPGDISILSSEYTDADFHARFSCKKKEYHYYVWLKETRDPFLRNYMYHFPYPLDFRAMEKGMKYFIGTHDFTSFCSAKTEVEDKVRTIEYFDYEKTDHHLIFKICGDGFLYNMVRIIIGTVLETGTGKRKPEDIPEIFAAKDRAKAGKTAPGQGLYLYKVYY